MKNSIKIAGCSLFKAKKQAQKVCSISSHASNNRFGPIIAILVASVYSCSAWAGQVVNVYSATELQNALKNAAAGDEIIVNPGTYVGNKGSSGNTKSHFFSDKSGTASAPIILRSKSTNNKQVLKGDDINSGYIFYLTGDYWQIKDLKFSTAQKGIMLEGANNNKIDNVEVSNLGAEAVHFRYYSSNNELSNCYIHNTGKRVGQEGFGEGVYVGTHDGHTASKLDPSNDNRIGGCTIGPEVTAEAFDIKAGVSGTVIESNYISAKGLIGTAGNPAADSFIDLKGTDNIIRYNIMNWDNDSNLDHAIFTYQEHRNSNIYDNQFTLPSQAAIYKLLEEMVHSVDNVRLDGGTKIVQADYQNNKWDSVLDPSIEKATRSYSCFDELPNGCGSVPTDPGTPTTGPSGPKGYVYAADEGQVVDVVAEMDIAYGANGTFNYLYNQTANVTCNNATFGDPVPGQVKACFTKTSASTEPPVLEGCDGIKSVVWKAKTEVQIAPTNCVQFDRDMAGKTLQAWDSDENNSCDFRGVIESASNSSISATVTSNYAAFNGLSGDTFILKPTNNCQYIKIRGY